MGFSVRKPDSRMEWEIEEAGEKMTVAPGCIGFEFYGRPASHTGFHNDVSGISEENLVAEAKKRIRRFLDAPYLVGKYDCELWREIGVCPYSGRFQIRLPHWHTGQVLAELQRLGFRLYDKTNLYVIAPMRLSRAEMLALMTPLMAAGSRAKPEAELVEALAQQAAFMGDADKQLELFGGVH